MGELEEGRKGQWGYVEGGNGRLSEILAENARALGADIKVNSKVDEIIYDGNNSPAAVRLQNG